MFRSTSFIFDSVPSETYGLMIYFLDDESKKEVSLGTDIDVIEDRTPKRFSPIHYGVDVNKSMSFPLIFGSTEYLSDWDVDAILSWLTGHQKYKWLEYVDGDHYVRYRCHLNNMRSVYINGLPVAFECDVECDSQFAYEYPIFTEITATNGSNPVTLDFLNRSSYNGYLFPTLHLEFGNDCNSLSIINETDNNREFKINYFDRVLTDSSNNEKAIDTTIAKESAASINEDDFMSWQAKTLPSAENYGEILYGDNTMVALPLDSDVALYSKDGGTSWHETTLPHSGGWAGCYGENGFVAVCTDAGSAIATYSQTGEKWNINPIELPVAQDWTKVFFVETKGFMPNQYVAIGGVNSSTIAISTSGWSWTSASLPSAQEWRSVFYGANKIIAVGGNSNIAAVSTDAIHWTEFELPENAAWTDGCYGENGFIIVCDSLYGSGTRDPIALTSLDGESWNTIEMPIGAWSSVTFGTGGYLAVGDKQYAHSLDNATYTTNTLPASVEKVIAINEQFVCSLGTNKYITSDASSTVRGIFEIPITTDVDAEIKNVYVYAELQNTVGDTSYASNGSKLLASNTVEGEEITETGGSWIAITTDLRYGLGIDGVMMSAIYDADTQTAKISYVADVNHTSTINAPLTVKVIYQVDINTDLGYDGLTVDVDNLNQIITTNKQSLNLYEYFNMKFFRLVKGLNKLKFSTDNGECKITMKCEFLRKVGGR